MTDPATLHEAHNTVAGRIDADVLEALQRMADRPEDTEE